MLSLSPFDIGMVDLIIQLMVPSLSVCNVAFVGRRYGGWFIKTLTWFV